MTPTLGAAGDVVLSVAHVAVRFGGLVALSDLNFTVRDGEIVGLIGPNGAGKTTAFNVFTGFLQPEAREVLRVVGLEGRAQDTAGTLPYGEQRLLGMALALAAKPSMLLLDEPVSGMNASESAK